jgi:hypothetical protein
VSSEGTCPVCKGPHRVERGRIAPHCQPARYHINGEVPEHVPGAVRACEGSGKRSVERRAELRDQRNLARIHHAREIAGADAQVAHDALASGVRSPVPIAPLITNALIVYRASFPSSRAQECWSTLERSVAVRGRWRRTNWTVDVYCTFCRALLLINKPRGGSWGAATHKHTVLCALRVLAGLSDPVDPGQRRLPAEAVDQ